MTNRIPNEDAGEKMEITYINIIIKYYQKWPEHLERQRELPSGVCCCVLL
jgi:hypothetical protein